MSFRKFGTGEVTGADETYQTVQQQREAVRRNQVGESEDETYAESPVDGEETAQR